MPHAIAGERENRRVREQAAAMALSGQRDALEFVGVAECRLGQTVKLRELRVHHGPVRVQELAQREAAGEHFTEEGLRLADHATLQRLVVVGVELLVGLEHADLSQAQPLRGKGVCEALRTRIGQETRDLLREHRLVAELALLGEGEQLGIRHRVPEQVGQARRDLPVIERLTRCVLVALGDEKEALRVQDGEHPGFHRIAEGLLRIEFALHDAQVVADLLVSDGTAKGALRQRGETDAGLLHIALFARHVVVAELLLFVLDDRPLPRDCVHDEKGVARLARFIGELHLPGHAADLRADEGHLAMTT